MAENTKTDSTDTKTTEKSPLTLYDLPIHVLERIKGKLPLVDCLALRKVSRDLRSLVDSTEGRCDVMEFGFGRSSSVMHFDNVQLVYDKMQDGGCKVASRRLDTQTNKRYQDPRNFTQVLMADAASFWKNPKLEIGHIRFIGYRDIMGIELAKFFKSLDFQLNVRSIEIGGLEMLHSILEFLNPEKLEEILCDFRIVPKLIEAAETDLEILKNPRLKIRKFIFTSYSDESSVKFSEVLKSINSQLKFGLINVEDGRWIPSILKFVNPEKVDEIDLGDSQLTVDQFNEVARMQQWKTRMRFCMCPNPGDEVGLERFVDFKETRCYDFELNDENLIKIRDILLNSPHFDAFKLSNPSDTWQFDEVMKQMYENIDRVMIENPAYDASTRRFSIPDSQDFLQLKLEHICWRMLLTITRTQPK